MKLASLTLTLMAISLTANAAETSLNCRLILNPIRGTQVGGPFPNNGRLSRVQIKLMVVRPMPLSHSNP